MLRKQLLSLGEYAAAGLYEEPERGLFYRKALGLRRFYENCDLAEYKGEALYPSGVIRQRMAVTPWYMTGLTTSSGALAAKDPTLSETLRREFDRFRSTVPKAHVVGGNMYNHSMPHYGRILREGLLSYGERIERIKDRDLREGLAHLLSGIACYARRCVAYLEAQGAEEGLVAALKQVPMGPARNAYEAILSWNFIMYLDNCDNLGPLERELAPFFRGEDLVPLLENLYTNLDENGGYSMSLTGECPALTVQCLRAAKGKRRPMIELFVGEDTPEEIWEAALETVRTGGGQPAFYHGGALLSGLKKRFPSIKEEDLALFCGGGCTESMLGGLSNVGSLDAGIHLLLLLEETLYASLPEAESFEEFYEAFLARVRQTVEEVKGQIHSSRLRRAEENPLPMRTLLVDDCIDRGRDYNAGGARYGWSIINFAGMINVIDSLLALRTLVFEEGRYTKEALLDCLRRNDPALRQEVLHHVPGYGRDEAQADAIASRVSRDIFSMTEGGDLAFGEGFLSASIQFMTQAEAGRCVGATPDGRLAGEPLCDSLAAIHGRDTKGPTALLNSVTSLSLDLGLGVPVLNFNVSPRYHNAILKALILGYMQKGGIQMQITCASRETLKEAYEHPELHSNLVVRVGGYSEYFNRLPDDLKRMILSRTVQEDAWMSPCGL